jgi:integrase
MALTNIKILKLKPKDSPYKVSDEKGLFLLVNPNGNKLWRFKYRIDKKEKSLSIGKYPDVPLASSEIEGVLVKGARQIRDEARQLVSAGIDPSKNKREQKEAKLNAQNNSFELVTREWLDVQADRLSKGYKEDITRRLEKNVFPWLGELSIEEIKPPDILKTVKRIEGKGTIETAHRVLSNINKVFQYSVSTGKITENPAVHIKGALKPVKTKHLASITNPDKVGGLLRMLEGYQGDFIVRSALQLAPLVFVRPVELREAKWKEIDLKKAQWSFVASKTKTEHIVPLSKQAIEILKDIEPLTGEGEFVFPSARSQFKPMSNNAILSAFRRMGIAKEEMSGHGFRAMARTLLDEELHIRVEYIEHQLAHTVKDPLGRAYNRTTHIKERTKMMQAWADYLDELKEV